MYGMSIVSKPYVSRRKIIFLDVPYMALHPMEYFFVHSNWFKLKMYLITIEKVESVCI